MSAGSTDSVKSTEGLGGFAHEFDCTHDPCRCPNTDSARPSAPPATRFGPCNYCKQPLVRLEDGGWGVAGDATAQNCSPSPDGWHQANRLSDGSFSIGGNVWPGLSKLVEEIGELGQVLGKLIALHGGTDHWDGTDLSERLHDELADVQAAIRFVITENRLNVQRIDKRTFEKVALFNEWQEAQS